MKLISMIKFIEMPASKQALSQRKLILGVGTNDVSYVTQPKINKYALIMRLGTICSDGATVKNINTADKPILVALFVVNGCYLVLLRNG